jgi:hypothetical protein
VLTLLGEPASVARRISIGEVGPRPISCCQLFHERTPRLNGERCIHRALVAVLASGVGVAVDGEVDADERQRGRGPIPAIGPLAQVNGKALDIPLSGRNPRSDAFLVAGQQCLLQKANGIGHGGGRQCALPQRLQALRVGQGRLPHVTARKRLKTLGMFGQEGGEVDP